MAETNFLTYKDKPLVRKGNEIYYGDMSDKSVSALPFFLQKMMASLKLPTRYLCSCLILHILPTSPM